ncbi:plasmid partitioning protein RepB [Xinfangfangia sp. D13-10-4-6]|uniref:plasmid partitioning protein RepB n=1 Tax=Pseudogemmobacter hezensis TaxID=2737662 RepID=UPI001556B3FD|nr:plasmid partitioning protein RepB [Pseudogemmobacter hezensis]NPD14696.1 plasmid partitioning protein RepB [Pseudogemmobacter hezensis]
MRRDLLASSLKAVRDGKQTPPTEPEPKARRPAGILDVQRGLDQLSAGAPRSIDTAQIADSAIRDRFDITDGIEDLVTSIRASGQRLPVLLRRVQGAALPYEVVYGRRRIEACRQLGIEVQAYISEMDDREALISQGLENAARLQRSFIEQAVYADRLLNHGLTRDEVTGILAVDKTMISRMLGVVSTVPAAVIAAIGPAHDSGRRPWQALRDSVIARPDLAPPALLALIDPALPSNDRLLAVLKGLKAPSPEVTEPAPAERMVKRVLTPGLQVEREAKRLTLRLSGKEFAGFSEFVDARLDDLLAEFRASSEPK